MAQAYEVRESPLNKNIIFVSLIIKIYLLVEIALKEVGNIFLPRTPSGDIKRLKAAL